MENNLAYWIHTNQNYLQKINQMKHKEIIVISIKANNRDLPKNLKLGLKMKVVFFSSPFIKKKNQVLCTHS